MNFVNLRKSTVFAFVLLFALTAAFADKARFYQNGKVIDTMYVDSAEGLRVRDKPSLKSNRLCALQHRLPVKVVAIGKEETIDGITAPWVEILLPCYEWKGEKPEYGWVFGEYLAEEMPSFRVPKSASELGSYLSSTLFVANVAENINFGLYAYKSLYSFCLGIFLCPDNSYSIKKLPGDVEDDPIVLGKGTWQAMSKNSVMLIDDKTNKKMEMTIDEINTENFTCRVSDNSFEFTKTAGAYIGMYYETFKYYRYVTFDIKEMPHLAEKTVSPTVNFFYIYEHIWDVYKEEFHDMLISGVDMRYSKYEQQYHDYWNPIMAEHQKKADAMK